MDVWFNLKNHKKNAEVRELLGLVPVNPGNQWKFLLKQDKLCSVEHGVCPSQYDSTACQFFVYSLQRGQSASIHGVPGAVRSDNVKNLHITQKHRNSAAAHARKVLPFSVKNELGLEYYLGSQCTKFGENR